MPNRGESAAARSEGPGAAAARRAKRGAAAVLPAGCGAAAAGDRAADRGAAAIEYGALLPAVIVIMLLAFQGYTASTTVERVENAARTGAREAGQRYDPERCPAAALGAMPGWLNDHQIDGGRTGDGVYCRVRAKLPLLWKGVPVEVTVNRTVTMPLG